MVKQKTTPNLKKNISISTLYQVLTMVLPLITAPYAARVLGVDGIGVYSYTHAYSMYFSLFAALGTLTYGSREIARHRDNRNERSQLFWEIEFLTILTSCACIAVWGVWTVASRRYRIYYLILTLNLFASMVDISWLYSGLEQFQYTVLQNSICRILGAASIFVFIKKADDLWLYVLIMSLTGFIANLSMWIHLSKFVDRVPFKGLRVKRHFKETLIYFIPAIATSVYTILDKTLIGLITHDSSENGNYEQATKIINMAKTLSFAGLNAVLQARISYLFAEERYDEIKRRIESSMDYILFMGFGLCFGLIGVASRFVPLFFGPGYDKTIELIRILAPLTVIIGLSNCLGSQFYSPAGYRKESARYIIIGSCVNLVFNLILIPAFNSYGAAVATILAETVISALYMKNCRGYYRIRGLIHQAWRKVVAGAAMLAVVSFIGVRIQNPFVAIAMQVITGGATYCLVLTLLRDSFIWDLVVPQAKAMGQRLLK